MLLLIVLLLAFAVMHLLPAIPRLKNLAKQNLGKAYGPIYGIGSLVLLIGIIAAFRVAPATEVYAMPSWGRYANFLFTLIAFIFVGIFMFRGSWRNAVKYPMGIAVGFWAFGHLLANGDVRSIVLFGGLALIAALQVFFFSRLVDRVPTEQRGGHNMLSVLFGIAAYAVMAQMHGALMGVPVFNLAGLSQ